MDKATIRPTNLRCWGGAMNIDKILKFEPKVNVQMLLFLFLNAVAFDSLYWITEDFIDSGEVIIVKWIVYAVAFVGSLTAFKLEFNRLNKREQIFLIDDFGVGYSARNWKNEDAFIIRILKTVKQMFKSGEMYSGEEIQLQIDQIIKRME
jgi:hypothetical protein